MPIIGGGNVATDLKALAYALNVGESKRWSGGLAHVLPLSDLDLLR